MAATWTPCARSLDNDACISSAQCAFTANIAIYSLLYGVRKAEPVICSLTCDWLVLHSHECDVDLQPVGKRGLHVFIRLGGLLLDWMSPDHVTIMCWFSLPRRDMWKCAFYCFLWPTGFRVGLTFLWLFTVTDWHSSLWNCLWPKLSHLSSSWTLVSMFGGENLVILQMNKNKPKVWLSASAGLNCTTCGVHFRLKMDRLVKHSMLK